MCIRDRCRTALTGRLRRSSNGRLVLDLGPSQAQFRGQPSYSKPILRSTWYSTISPPSTTADDFTTSIVLMFRTVREAVATAWRAASDHDFGLVPTISRMM